MTPRELEKIGVELYGSLGWRQSLAASLGVHRNTVTRWMKGGDIPTQWAAHIKLMAVKKQQRVRDHVDREQ